MTAERSADPVPHDPELERAIIGCCLVASKEDRRTAAVAALRASRDHMWGQHNRTVATALLELVDRGEPPDLILLYGELKRRGDLEEVGGQAMLAELMEVPSSVNVAAYARRVRVLAWRRHIAGRAEGLAGAASDGVSDRDLAELASDLATDRPPGSPLGCETLGSVLARPVPEIDWLIEGLWTHPEISILAGDGGIGKTWVLIHLALCLASGLPVFGRHPVKGPRRVGLLDLERGSRALDRRLHQAAQALEVPQEAADRVVVLRELLVLDDPADADRLVSWAREQGLEWLGVDSWSAAMSGDDCSGPEIQRLARLSLYPLRDAGVSVLLSDHVRKLRGDRQLDSIGESLRGDKRKRNAVDSLYGLAKREDCLVLSQDKSNHHAAAEPMRIRLEQGGASIVWLGSLDGASDAVQDAVVAMLEAEERWELHRGEIVGRLSQYSKRAVDSALSELVRRGVLTKSRDGKRTTYRMGRGAA
jgi:hypothetical protein